ncbi:MAG: transcription-repair coupling factor [Oscillospiraceae bacterium]|nr:transcription-repair coupling factor [Oscillospiraceae bacterium]
MNIKSILSASAEFRKIEAAAREGAPIAVCGTADAQKAHMISSLVGGGRALVVTYNEQAAKRLSDDLSFFMPSKIVYIPPKPFLLHKVEAADHEQENNRASAVKAIDEGSTGVLSIESLLQYVPDAKDFRSLSMRLSVGETLNLDRFIRQLTATGYSRIDTVAQKGQFAVRGGIIDVFSPNMTLPVRMELFGDEIDLLRTFDVMTQLSIDHTEFAEIVPVTSPAESGSLLSYFDDGDLIFFDEPQRISEAAKVAEFELGEDLAALRESGEELPDKKYMNDYAELVRALNRRSTICLSALSRKSAEIRTDAVYELTCQTLGNYGGNVEFLMDDIERWHRERSRVIILGGSTGRAQRLTQALTDRGISAAMCEPDSELAENVIAVMRGSLTKGFEYPLINTVIVSDREIFAEEKKRRSYRRSENEQKIRNIDKLEVGDYVVHKIHGIGKYLGIERMTVNKIVRDYIKLEYRGEDHLFIPVGQLDNISKYVGGSEDRAVRLNRLGSSEWASAKRKVKQSVRDLADGLVKLYAERERSQGFAFAPDTPWQHQFESEFIYEETEDQLRSSDEMKRDMEKARPMDRLLCGDVGFGKTEVAMRGAFKAVMDGKQVAYLVPTTILASQHYNNFVQRMSGYPMTVRMLSRFCKPKQVKETLRMLETGECDIVVGTHKLLQKNVKFKDLGLLIVDEEQRFGVAHKEKIKELKKNVDVLTLSATPIPRTLHMAMVGIRDMSVLTTPPGDRYPVQTYVMEYNQAVIHNAITRELGRGGQVYYLCNRIASLDRIANRVAEMVPDAHVAVAHGRMSEAELEETMMRVMEGEIDVLICTTIIETGLDIPNVNTIIIENADCMGLSQLYQLRGRVGRSNRLAYAYLTYKRDKSLDEVAEKRLRAIREFTEFGSGFKIAMRDLEIRGAGNVLGPEQHGFMAAVGYDMYCTLLEEAVNEAMGLPERPKKEETVVEIDVSAYIPDKYIPTSELRIEAYKRIAAIESRYDRDRAEEEFEDRYGNIPEPVSLLMDVAMIRAKAREVGVVEISHSESGIVFKLSTSSPPPIELIMELAANNRGKILYGAGEKPYILSRGKLSSEKNIIKNINNVLKSLQSKEE